MMATCITTPCSETRREYVPVGLEPAPLRATVSEQAVATQVFAGRSKVYGTAVLNQSSIFDFINGALASLSLYIGLMNFPPTNPQA